MAEIRLTLFICPRPHPIICRREQEDFVPMLVVQDRIQVVDEKVVPPFGNRIADGVDIQSLPLDEILLRPERIGAQERPERLTIRDQAGFRSQHFADFLCSVQTPKVSIVVATCKENHFFFPVARFIAAIFTIEVAIVAILHPCLGKGVTADGQLAGIGAVVGVILIPVVAAFSLIQLQIPTRDQSAIILASARFDLTEIITTFAGLHKAITADGQLAVIGASVQVRHVAVVALLLVLQHKTVTAACLLAGIWANVGVVIVTVVAFLSALDNAVAAGEFRFDSRFRATRV